MSSSKDKSKTLKVDDMSRIEVDCVMYCEIMREQIIALRAIEILSVWRRRGRKKGEVRSAG
jgi:hypothetical protein